MKTLRCMAYKQDNVFVAACLDLSLAAQGDTMQEAMNKLEEQVDSYIEEAYSDPAHTCHLLKRKAPFSMWAKYWFLSLKLIFRGREQASVFTETCSAPV